jgi:hypothetical protein
VKISNSTLKTEIDDIALEWPPDLGMKSRTPALCASVVCQRCVPALCGGVDSPPRIILFVQERSVLGKGDPKSGQIAGRLNRQPNLKSRHSRTYALGSDWHATWLFNRDNHRESPQLVNGGNDGAACLAFPMFA